MFHGVRNIVANLRVLLLLAMPGGEGASALPNSSADTSNVRGALFALPLPPPLDIHDSNAAEKWKEFEQAWKNYSIALKLHQEPEAVQVASLLTVVGAEARKVWLYLFLMLSLLLFSCIRSRDFSLTRESNSLSDYWRVRLLSLEPRLFLYCPHNATLSFRLQFPSFSISFSWIP